MLQRMLSASNRVHAVLAVTLSQQGATVRVRAEAGKLAFPQARIWGQGHKQQPTKISTKPTSVVQVRIMQHYLGPADCALARSAPQHFFHEWGMYQGHTVVAGTNASSIRLVTAKPR